MPPSLIAREFPCFDGEVEASIQYFTDLSIACDAAVLGLAHAQDALRRVIEKHRICSAVTASPAATHSGPIQIGYVLQRVWEAVREILDHERRTRAARDVYMGHEQMRAREAINKAKIESFLTENATRIRGEIAARVLPVITQAAEAGLPAVSLAAPIYFMARAVLWRTSPEFARSHEASLRRETEAYKDIERAKEWAETGLRPDLFLDLEPEKRHLRVGYKPSSAGLSLALAGLKPQPDSLAEATPTPPSANLLLSMLSESLRRIRDLLLPAFKMDRRRTASTGMAPTGMFGHLVDR